MTIFDYVFLGLLVISALVGLARGLIAEVFSLVSMVLSCYVAKLLAPSAAPFFAKWIQNEWLCWAAAFLCVLVLALIVLAIVRMLLREFLTALGISPVDRFLGACFGVARALLVALIVVAAGGFTSWPHESWWREAKFAPPLETAVLALRHYLPEELAKQIKFR